MTNHIRQTSQSRELDRDRQLSRDSLRRSAASTIVALASSNLVPVIDQARIHLACTSGPDVADMRQRRRSQNRASQRAFRDRKACYLKSLEAGITELAEMHQNLHNAYQQKVVEVDTLHARVDKLNGDIRMLQIPGQYGQEIFPCPEGDYDASVFTIKNENETGVQSSFDVSRPETNADYSVYYESTFMMSPVEI